MEAVSKRRNFQWFAPGGNRPEFSVDRLRLRIGFRLGDVVVNGIGKGVCGVEISRNSVSAEPGATDVVTLQPARGVVDFWAGRVRSLAQGRPVQQALKTGPRPTGFLSEDKGGGSFIRHSRGTDSALSHAFR